MNKRFLIVAGFVLMLSLGGPVMATAQSGPSSPNNLPGSGPTSPNNTGTTLINPLGSGSCASGSNCLMDFLNKILAFVIRIGTIVVILMMVYVGYKFVAAQGEPGKISEARQMLLWTVVGALILLGAQAIAYGIQATVQALSVGK